MVNSYEHLKLTLQRYLIPKERELSTKKFPDFYVDVESLLLHDVRDVIPPLLGLIGSDSRHLVSVGMPGAMLLSAIQSHSPWFLNCTLLHDVGSTQKPNDNFSGALPISSRPLVFVDCLIVTGAKLRGSMKMLRAYKCSISRCVAIINFLKGEEDDLPPINSLFRINDLIQGGLR